MTNESISELMNKPLTETDLNNFCYYFTELLELSIVMQMQIENKAEETGSKKLEIYAEGCDQLISKYHRGFLDLKKKYNWDSNIGEDLITLKK